MVGGGAVRTGWVAQRIRVLVLVLVLGQRGHECRGSIVRDGLRRISRSWRVNRDSGLR